MRNCAVGRKQMNQRRRFFSACMGVTALLAVCACFPEIPALVTESAGGSGGTAVPDATPDVSDARPDSSDSGGADGGDGEVGVDTGGSDSGGADVGGTDTGPDVAPDAVPDVVPDVSPDGAAGSGPACPDDMVHAEDLALSVSFCVDRTEVTQAKYVEFLMAVNEDVAQTDQPPECAFNESLTYTPDGSCPSFSSSNNYPVFCVDWCDAYAYCAFRGKRLCGALTGGTLALDGPLTTDEWHFACTGGFETTYPYGDNAIVGACHIPKENTPTDSSDDNQKAPVGSYPDCEGGFPGIFDMQGNAAEWTDRCDPGDGTGTEMCMTRGGHTYGSADYWKCSNLIGKVARNDPSIRQNGIRCCGDTL
ncbi:MAG: hypothetical protein CVU63_16290 [Deltaproteobacteria bacterium HGW-Deltaproteobacteria-20]|nr:MAG: hypothetical protein CVU63_16290 [Deltaproteobacteria bacterium HGW-Deltaproteobacteria-20]